MPCYEPDWPGESKEDLRAKVSYLTRLLCENLTLMEKADEHELADDRNAHMDVINPELQEWWEHHQRLDAMLATGKKPCLLCQGDGWVMHKKHSTTQIMPTEKIECCNCEGTGIDPY